MTSITRQIGGISLSVKLAKKLNKSGETIPLQEISESPLVHVSVVESEGNETFDVTIIAFIPAMLSFIEEPESAIEMPLDHNRNSIFLQYNGIFRLQTPIQTNQEDNALLCREFELLYKTSDNNIYYDAYMFVINYGLMYKNMQKAEAIVVMDKNLDPETSRGTVTTSTGST